jgi:hypothetical protein
VVWLGEEVETDGKAIKLMHQTYHYSSTGQSSGKKFGRDMSQALHNFFGRRYWQRLWIIQELALNNNSTLIL